MRNSLRLKERMYLLVLDAGFHGVVVFFLFVAGFLLGPHVSRSIGPSESILCSVGLVMIYIFLVMLWVMLQAPTDRENGGDNRGHT